MKVLNDTGAGCDVEIHLNHTIDSWTIRITDATRDGARAFATLDAAGLIRDEPP
jgi:hypothetical protein